MNARRSRGVALVLVLMVTGVIGLVVLQFALSARQDVDLAQRLLDRAEATAMLRSREATLMFELATRPWQRSPAPDSLASRWNFHGEPFDHAGAAIEMQDLNGLYGSTRFIERDRRLEQLLVFAGLPIGEAREATENLASYWRRTATLPFLQTLGSLRTILGINVEDAPNLRTLVTVYPVIFFNPLTAPREVLRLYFQDFAVDAILAARLPDALNPRPPDYAYSGDREIVYYPGPALSIRIRTKVGEVEVQDESIWVIKPFSEEPVRRWGPGS